MNVNNIKINYKQLIENCFTFNRNRFFNIFLSEEILKKGDETEFILTRINSSILHRLADQQGGGLGIFTDFKDEVRINLLSNIWSFLNILVKIFLIHEELLDTSYNDMILEDIDKCEQILKKTESTSKNFNSLLFIFNGLSKIPKYFNIKYNQELQGYGPKVWESLNTFTDHLDSLYFKELNEIFSGTKKFTMLLNRDGLKLSSDVLENVRSLLNSIKVAHNSLGGNKSFVIFQALCHNAFVLKNDKSSIYNSLKNVFSGLIYDKENIIANAIKVQICIKKFILELKKIGIKQVGDSIGAYFLRDLATEKDYLKLPLLNTRFSRYCFKVDSNAQKFVILSGLILLPSIFYEKINNLLKPIDMKNNESLSKFLEKILNWKNDFITKYHGKNWHRFTEDYKKDLEESSRNNHIHILIMASIDWLFSNTLEDNKYNENFGLLNEIFYLKCQSQCNNSSQYLCWNRFSPKIKGEPPLIKSLCNVADFCLEANISDCWS